jgi:hypothetical protein
MRVSCPGDRPDSTLEDRLDLPEVVDVVPGHHLRDPADRLFSALGVDAEVVPLLFGVAASTSIAFFPSMEPRIRLVYCCGVSCMRRK